MAAEAAALPFMAAYSGATNETLAAARKQAEATPQGYHPTVFNPKTLTSSGRVRVARDRVPQGKNVPPSPDAITKGAVNFDPESPEAKQVKGFEIYYEVHGSGPEKILFLMGLNNSCFGWLPQVEEFCKDPRYSCLVFDNRGYGNTDTPGGVRSYTTSEMAKDALEVMDSLGPEWSARRSVHVVGVSMGGMISLELAKQQPERWASVSLISTTSGQARGEKSLLASLPPWKGVSTIGQLVIGRILNTDTDESRITALLRTLCPPSYLSQPSPAHAGKTNEQVLHEMFMWRYHWTRKQTLFGALAQIRTVATHRVSNAQLRAIGKSVPKVLICTGDNDNLVNPANSGHLRDNIPGSEYVLFEGAGHAIGLQTPERLNPVLLRTFEEGRKRVQDEPTKWLELAHPFP